MICYNCGCQLSEQNYCISCGADVTLYKKIIYASNMFYNDGLEKAKARDLSGAVNSLRQSLKLNKNNVKARNLLGLVYFEMGEAVSALSEWVISNNLRSKKNIAANYIEMVQSNASRLDNINQTIKKYNKAYYYCTQGSKDLAVIQLKKVLSLNPKLVRAHLLLALLYLDSEQWEKARKELRKCLTIDRNNTLALNYLNEAEQMLSAGDNSGRSAETAQDDAVRYQSDNEIIIQPVNTRESRRGGLMSIVNIVIGLAVGMAAMYFLVTPALMTNVRTEADNRVREIGNQLDDKTATILDLEQQLETLQNDNTELQQQLNGYVGEDGTLTVVDSLMMTVSSYLSDQNVKRAGEELDALAAQVDVEQASAGFKALYQAMRTAIGPNLAKAYNDDGETALAEHRYEDAIAALEKAVEYDAGNAAYLYNLATAYRENERPEDALAAYQKVMELFPDSDEADKAEGYVKQMTEE